MAYRGWERWVMECGGGDLSRVGKVACQWLEQVTCQGGGH
jgi:hypothetical protein